MRRLVSTLAALAFVLAGPAWAQGSAKQDPQVVLTGKVEIAQGERVDDVVSTRVVVRAIRHRAVAYRSRGRGR